MAAEYEIVDSPTSMPPPPATSYLTTDHLGSPRVITDENGEVISRRDFMPFGEDIYVGVGGRTENLKYALSTVDHIRQRFTGYEKDDESGLDFAQARMYQNKHGRFTAPDPLMASANPANPQTFNRYIYTGNNPVNYTDPSGLEWCMNSSSVVVFTGSTPCSSTQTDVTGTTGTIGRNSCFTTGTSNDCYYQGERVRFNKDGSTSLVGASSASHAAISQGFEVQNQTVEAVTVSASDTISEALVTTTADIGRTISPMGLPPCRVCGSSSTKHVTRLMSGTGASATEMADAAQAFLDIVGMAPVIGEPADAISGVVSLIRGDYVGASLSAGAMVPLLGTAAGPTKIARRVGNAVDSGSDVTKLRNGHLANSAHPRTGVPFDLKGFPNFSEHLYKGGKNDVIIKPTARRDLDVAAANKAANYKSTPKNFTWHHHQDTGRMQLVDSEIHRITGHTGGWNLW